jgi:hypothetical protein
MTEHDPSRRRLLKHTAVGGLVAAIGGVPGCVSVFGDKKSPVETLRQGEVYLFLIDANEDIKHITDVANNNDNKAKYGHIELVYNGVAYGARDDIDPEIPVSSDVLVSSDIPLSRLERLFDGHDYEVRTIELKDPHRAIQYFSKELRGNQYDNPAQVIIEMCSNSGNMLTSVHPASVNPVDRNDTRLKDAMESMGMVVPRNGFVYLPDQFQNVGVWSEKSTFRVDKR